MLLDIDASSSINWVELVSGVANSATFEHFVKLAPYGFFALCVVIIFAFQCNKSIKTIKSAFDTSLEEIRKSHKDANERSSESLKMMMEVVKERE